MLYLFLTFVCPVIGTSFSENIVVLKVAGDMLRGWLHWGMLQHFGQNELTLQISHPSNICVLSFLIEENSFLRLRKVEPRHPAANTFISPISSCFADFIERASHGTQGNDKEWIKTYQKETNYCIHRCCDTWTLAFGDLDFSVPSRSQCWLSAAGIATQEILQLAHVAILRRWE